MPLQCKGLHIANRVAWLQKLLALRCNESHKSALTQPYLTNPIIGINCTTSIVIKATTIGNNNELW